MHITEVCKLTGLTRKAVEYYQLKGLIIPEIDQNGYRSFTTSDVSLLREIALLRKLNLSIEEIRQVINSENKRRILASIKQAKELETKAALSRVDLISQLIAGAELSEIQDQLDILEQQQAIKEKLAIAFPGYYGRYLSIHFGQFLKEPIKTEGQKELYDEIVRYLDETGSFQLSEELQPILDEIEQYMDDEKLEALSDQVQTAYDDFESYWETNEENIRKYMDFKKTEEYQNSKMPQLMEDFRHLGETKGYYDRFIPMMRKLSPAYDSYYSKMLRTNEKLMEKMPELKKP